MIAIELYINDEKVATGGVDSGVTSAIVSWVRARNSDEWHSGVSLRGLDNRISEHLKWIDRALRIGDEVRIRLVESDKISPVIERKPTKGKWSESQSDAQSDV